MKISIVTVSFNSAATIERTLQSVAEQTYANLEHVIVDGGSKDQTMDIVRRYPQRLGKIVSERDQGIYDAMNKGVELATGDYLLFLNSDDWLVSPDIIEKAVAAFDPACRMQHGRIVYHSHDGRVTRMGAKVKLEDLRYELKNFHQPACFFARELFQKHGMFNIKYRISADYDLMRRFLQATPSHFLDMDITNMSDNGASASQHARGIQECIAISTSFGESALRASAQGQWTRFWLHLRYKYPFLYAPAKKLRDRLRSV